MATVFEQALNRAMLYEVGGFWNLNAPGALNGSIASDACRRANGYTNDPDDQGGETKYGIAKAANPDLDIAGLDWAAAQRVYMKRYWLPGDCDALPARLALVHFDGCLQHGVGKAGTFLQSAVGATVDGDVGPATIALVGQVDELVTVNKICDLRVAFYRQIVENNPTQAKFLDGWLRRIEETRTYINNIGVSN